MKKVDELMKNSNIKIDLDKEYIDAISNENFKKFLIKYKIKENQAKCNLSRLNDSFIEHCNCIKCDGLNNCLNEEKGFRLTPISKDNIIDFSLDECKYLKKQEKDNEYTKNIDLFSTSKYVYNASFKDIYKDDKNRLPIIKYFKDFITKYLNNDRENIKGLYLNGSFGSGKTYLISALFNELAKKGVKSCVIYYPLFLVELKSSFQDSTYKDKYNYIKSVPLLLFDDIGAENSTNYSRDEVLCPILQYRMENNLPTFFTSNLNLKEMENNLSITNTGVDKIKARRIIERIKQLTINIELISENRRN